MRLDSIFYFFSNVATSHGKSFFTSSQYIFGVSEFMAWFAYLCYGYSHQHSSIDGVWPFNQILASEPSSFVVYCFIPLSNSFRATSILAVSPLLRPLVQDPVLSVYSWKPTMGVRTADPWSGNFLCWPLDHATPALNLYN